MKTNLMHYLSSVYFVNQPLHVSGTFVAHQQEVYVCIYIYTHTHTHNNWYVLCFSGDCLLTGLRWNIKYGHMFQVPIFHPFSSLYRTNFRSIPESKATYERVLPYGMKLYCHRPVNNKHYLVLSAC